MLYFLLIHPDESFHRELPPEQDAEVIERYWALQHEMEAAGVYRGSHRLREVATATTARVREGQCCCSAPAYRKRSGAGRTSWNDRRAGLPERTRRGSDWAAWPTRQSPPLRLPPSGA